MLLVLVFQRTYFHERATFTALRFPVLDVTGLVLAIEVVDSGLPR
jgi:hypothetical protein